VAGTVFFHSFREREILYDLIEMITGTRLTTSYPRVGGLARDLPEKLIPELKKFLKIFPGRIKEYETLADPEQDLAQAQPGRGKALRPGRVDLGVTGPNLRASAWSTTSGRRSPIPATSSTSSRCPSEAWGTPTTGTWCGWRRCGRAPGSWSRSWRASPAAP